MQRYKKQTESGSLKDVRDRLEEIEEVIDRIPPGEDYNEVREFYTKEEAKYRHRETELEAKQHKKKEMAPIIESRLVDAQLWSE